MSEFRILDEDQFQIRIRSIGSKKVGVKNVMELAW